MNLYCWDEAGRWPGAACSQLVRPPSRRSLGPSLRHLRGQRSTGVGAGSHDLDLYDCKHPKS